MLHLASASDPAWTARALERLDDVLVDHAHCEKKAASTAVNLIFRYGDRPELMAPLSALAREELAHFEELLDVLARRGIAFLRVHPTDYAPRLHAACRGTEPERLLDTLLVAALIEARSCERMRLLAVALPDHGDTELGRLYAGLLAAEARHHATYVELAQRTGLFRDDAVRERAAELARHEAEVLAQLPPGHQLHAG